MKTMKVWTVKFKGHYPVGASLVVTAESVELAIIWAEKELERIGLPQKIEPAQLIPYPTNHRYVRILNDGNY